MKLLIGRDREENGKGCEGESAKLLMGLRVKKQKVETTRNKKKTLYKDSLDALTNKRYIPL